jgi:thymidylate kinase
MHDFVRNRIFSQIHDLYDRDFRLFHQVRPFLAQKDEKFLILDRYFPSNVVYARMHGVDKPQYHEDHLLKPDLVILLRVRDPNYPLYRKLFRQRGDAIFKDPAVLYEEHQPQYLKTLQFLQKEGKIKKYTVVEALKPDTTEKVREIITNLQ